MAFKRLALLAAGIVFAPISAVAQLPSLQDQLDDMFSNFSTSPKVQTGLLLDKSWITSYIARYDGVFDTTASFKQLLEMYDDVYHAAYNKTSFKTPASIRDSAQAMYNRNTIPIAIIDYRYNALKPNVLSSSLITFSQDKYHDNTTAPATPFDTRRVFAMAPFKPHYSYNTLTFRIPSDLFASNITAGITSIEVDFDNGSGYQPITMNTDYPVTYLNAGKRTLKLRVTRSDNSVMVASSTFNINGSLAVNASLAQTSRIYLSADENSATYNGLVEPWDYYISGKSVAIGIFGKDSSGQVHTCIKQPIIFVEGIDFGYDHVGKHGELGLVDFFIFNEDYPQIRYGYELFDDLSADGYDVFYIDFYDGAKDMRQLAQTVSQIIQLINNLKCTDEENVVVGASMGGQVARYALAWMEANNIKHCTREYISFDSPHKGANIPLGLQHFLDFFSAGSQEAQFAKEHKISRKAAQQLLATHFIGGANNPQRASWLHDRNALGYPKKMRKTACVNGSANGTDIGFDPGDYLLNCIVSVEPYIQVNASVWANPGNNNGQIFHVAQTVTLDPNVIIGDSKNFVDPRPWDNAPGSPHNAIQLFAGPIIADSLPYAPPQGGILLGQITAFEDWCTFIPTVSALDINTNDLNYDIDGVIFDPNIPMPGVHPWDAVYFQDTNQLHVEITHPAVNGGFTNSEWLLLELPKNKNILPAILANKTFNYGFIRNKLPNVTVDAGGVIQVNEHGNTDFGDGSVTSNGSIFEVMTTDCNSIVFLQNGGTLQVGSADAVNKGIVKIGSGSKLSIMPGGRLLINDNSKVIIEEGAELHIHPNAVIQLLGNNAVLEIKGQVILAQGANFTFTYPNKPSGYVLFNSPPSTATNCLVSQGSGISINFTGLNSNDKVVEVQQPELWIPLGVTSFTLHRAKVELDTLARIAVIDVNTQVNITTSKITKPSGSNQLSRGITLFGQPHTISNTTFEFGHYGLEDFLTVGGLPLTLNACTFRDNGNGLYTQGKGATLNGCQFYRNYVGWNAYKMQWPSVLNNCTFGGNNINRMNESGIMYDGGAQATLQLNNCMVDNNHAEGIYMEGSLLKINCGSVKNNTLGGIRMNFNSTLDMSGDIGGGGGHVDMSGNAPGGEGDGYAIFLDNARDLKLNNGYNKLTPGEQPGYNCWQAPNGQGISTACVEAINGFLMKDYDECGNFDCSDIILPSDNNQWATPNHFPRWDYEYRIETSYYCESENFGPLYPRKVLLIDNNPSNYTSCPGSGNGSGNPSASATSLLNNCSTCRYITTQDFQNVKLNNAIKTAINAMDNSNNKRAVELLTQILKYPMANPTVQEKTLLKESYQKMQEALGNSFAAGQITGAQNATVLTTEVQEVIDIQTDELDRFPCDKFYHLRLATSMEQAQAYRLAERRDLAIPLFNSILSWARPEDYGYVLEWKCVTEAEQQVITGLISKEDYRTAVSACYAANTQNNRLSNNSDQSNSLNISENGKITVFPNPNDGRMTIQFILPEGKDNAELEIYDLSGKLVRNDQLTGNDGSVEIQATELNEGIYLYRVICGNNTIAQDKLVIIR